MKEPASYISFVVNQQAYELLIGNKMDDMYYVKKADTDIVYKVSSDKISAFADASFFSLTNSGVYATDETDFSSFEIEYGGQSATITLEREEDQNKSTESKKYYLYKPFLNNAEMDEQKYTSFLSAIQSIAVEQNTDLTTEGEPTLKITIKHFDTDRIDTISFYENNENVLVMTEDTVRGMISPETFQSFIEKVPL